MLKFRPSANLIAPRLPHHPKGTSELAAIPVISPDILEGFCSVARKRASGLQTFLLLLLALRKKHARRNAIGAIGSARWYP